MHAATSELTHSTAPEDPTSSEESRSLESELDPTGPENSERIGAWSLSHIAPERSTLPNQFFSLRA